MTLRLAGGFHGDVVLSPHHASRASGVFTIVNRHLKFHEDRDNLRAHNRVGQRDCKIEDTFAVGFGRRIRSWTLIKQLAARRARHVDNVTDAR